LPGSRIERLIRRLAIDPGVAPGVRGDQPSGRLGCRLLATGMQRLRQGVLPRVSNEATGCGPILGPFERWAWPHPPVKDVLPERAQRHHAAQTAPVAGLTMRRLVLDYRSWYEANRLQPSLPHLMLLPIRIANGIMSKSQITSMDISVPIKEGQNEKKNRQKQIFLLLLLQGVLSRQSLGFLL
jgi:hypothetical protein